jgi:aryl-alcohol dehydrogenase-like predicted oxidoreductase
MAVASDLAAKYGVSINEVVLAYLLNQPHQTIAIFGGSSPEQVIESAKADALRLSADEVAALRNA